MKAFLNRFKQPSTWAAISALGVLFGLPPGTVDLAVQIGVGVAGLAGVVLEEKGGAK
jgi:hypothetical protein